MDRPDSPSLIELENRHKRGASRLVLGGLAGLVVLGGLAFGAWALLAPSTCRQAAQAICDTMGVTDCALEANIENANLPRERCEESLRSTKSLEFASPAMKAMAGSTLVEELLMGREQADRMRQVLMSVEEQVNRERSVRPEHVAALVALGPQACMTILVHMGRPFPEVRAALRAALAQHAGRDFGDAPEAWMPWCTVVVQSAHGAR